MCGQRTTDIQQNPAGLCGVIVIDKPAGPTSMQVVAHVRRRAGGAKTGHAGTLDPLATGVLVLAIGRATKMIDRLMATTKRYRTTIDLTAFSTTDDREGELTPIDIAAPPTRDDVASALKTFQGRIQQRPPAFSAVKVRGRRAYQLARKGKPVETAPRAVTIHSLDLVRYAWPECEVEMLCEKGVYVRSLARDLGSLLGTGGHCATLRRTAVGPFECSTARTLDELPDEITSDDLISIERAVALLNHSADASTGLADSDAAADC